MDTKARPVPWYDWKEWRMVFHSLYNEDPKEQWKGIMNVNAWRARSKNVPVAVESTAQMLELLYQIENCQCISQEVSELPIWSSQRSHQELRLAASLSIIRMVNGIVDKEQKNEYARPVNVLAQSLNLPRWLVDLRHRSTHNDLPSLESLQSALQLSLSWLYTNYWIFQEESLYRYISSLYEDCKQLSDALLDSTSNSSNSIPKDFFITLTGPLLSKLSVHDCVAYFIPLLLGNPLDLEFPQLECFIYPPTALSSYDLILNRWISCIQFFSQKFSGFSASFLYQLLVHLENHPQLEGYKAEFLNQILYNLCTNEYISSILKTYTFSNHKRINKLKKNQEKQYIEWKKQIAPFSILQSMNYPLRFLVSYLYQGSPTLQSLFQSLLHEQSYITEKQAFILKDLSQVRQEITSLMEYINQIPDLPSSFSPSLDFSENPYITNQYYTYQNFLRTSTSTSTESLETPSTEIHNWVLSQEVDSLPIGSILEYSFCFVLNKIKKSSISHNSIYSVL